MGKDEFTIVVDNPTNSYFPGQTVAGRFNVELESAIRATEIFITFKGKGHCEWSEGGQHRQYYSKKEYYFKSRQTLYGREQTHQDNFELHQGSHSYPFSFQIPSDIVLPPSFDDQSNYVRYRIKATIVRHMSLNKHAIHVVNMICPLDLNKIMRNQDLVTAGEARGRKTLCCLLCESSPITVYVRTERRGCVPGDTIVFNAEINNMSRRRIKYSKAQLIMKVLLTSHMKSREYVKKFDKVYHGPIASGGSDLYRNEKLVIPPVPPSNLPGCKVIDVRYFVSIVVKPAGPALRLRVNSEVVIGSIPLQSVAADLGLTLPPLQGPTGLFDDTVLANMTPQASIEESAFGDVVTKRKREVEKGDAPTTFVPMYLHYKWDQQYSDLSTTKF